MLSIRLQTGGVCLCNWNISLLLFSYFCLSELQPFKCLEFSGGSKEGGGGGTIFDLNLVGRKNFEGKCNQDLLDAEPFNQWEFDSERV